MNGYFITGIGAGLLGIVIGFGSSHVLDGRALALEQASHAQDNQKHAEEISAINSASAKALSDALTKQQAAEGKVSTLETQYQTEVENHAKDSLAYRAQLASGAQRLRVHVTACSAPISASEGAPAAGGLDDSAPSADLSPAVATGAVAVVDSADVVAIRLAKLQAYVKEMQDEGYINSAPKE